MFVRLCLCIYKYFSCKFSLNLCEESAPFEILQISYYTKIHSDVFVLLRCSNRLCLNKFKNSCLFFNSSRFVIFIFVLCSIRYICICIFIGLIYFLIPLLCHFCSSGEAVVCFSCICGYFCMCTSVHILSNSPSRSPAKNRIHSIVGCLQNCANRLTG